jgi:DNA-binding CsgD family transcriptional regulator
MGVHSIATARVARDVRATIVADGVAGLGAEGFLRRVMRALDRVAPFDAGGFATVDPDTLLWTGCVLRGLPPAAMGTFAELELLQPDVLAYADMLAERRVAGVLSLETDGRLGRSTRHGALYAPHGMGDELRVTFSTGGRCHGVACLLRADGGPAFTAAEAQLVAGVAADVADGLRTSVSASRVYAGGGRGAGVLVVDDAANVLSVTDDAGAWIEELGGDAAGALPAVVHGVVAGARLRATGVPGPPARARVATPTGTWLTVSASALSGDTRAWALVLEPSRPSEVLDLVAEANDLTAREQEVLGMLVRGTPDKVVAARLALSPHTAREHTGRILRKFGVRTRGELQAHLLGAHYEPWLAA